MPSPPIQFFKYGKDKLSIHHALCLENGLYEGILDYETIEKINTSAEAVQKIVQNEAVVYGINTGFGVLASTIISKEDTKLLQHKILQSHSVGVDKPIDISIAKLMLITKVHALAQGYSGIQLATLERIIWYINNDAIPVVPEKGSVGASGDLAPLAHLFLPLIGLGEVIYKRERITTEKLFSITGLKPIDLGPKEGLALINGTQFILSFAIQAINKMHHCLETADFISAISIEALAGLRSPFDKRLHELRPYKGSQLVAQRLRLLLQDSQLSTLYKKYNKVQDPYSLRCIPQVHGASRNAWLHLKELVDIEMNAVTDNPIIFSEKDTISGGNFHGQPLALPLDYACFAAAELGNISDRRSYLLLEGKWGLPLLLMKDIGLNSGFMIAQYTTAALVSENKTLCYPASVDSIPTSLGQEDHVSMGSISARKLNQVLNNLQYILSIELILACQALELRRPLHSSPILEATLDWVRQHIAFAETDRIFANDIEIIHKRFKEFANFCSSYAYGKIDLDEGFYEFSTI